MLEFIFILWINLHLRPTLQTHLLAEVSWARVVSKKRFGLSPVQSWSSPDSLLNNLVTLKSSLSLVSSASATTVVTVQASSLWVHTKTQQSLKRLLLVLDVFPIWLQWMHSISRILRSSTARTTQIENWTKPMWHFHQTSSKNQGYQMANFISMSCLKTSKTCDSQKGNTFILLY